MASRRTARVGDLIREELALMFLTKAKDPRLKMISITGVKVGGDLRRAVVYYTIMDETIDRGEVKQMFQKAAGFFRREIGRVLTLKFTPELVFECDESQDYGRRMDSVLEGLKPDLGESDGD